MKTGNAEERGFALVAIIIGLSLAGLVLSGALWQSAKSMRTVGNTRVQTREFNQAEAAIAHAVSWLRENSQKLVYPFRRDQFYLRMERSATPVYGTNDSSSFKVPTRILLAGTNNAVILANNASLGTSLFPFTKDLTTNVVYDAVSEFASADLGDARVRITLVDVVAKTESLDYGNPPAAAPDTDFYPVYRIDAMSEVDRGAHVTAYVRGNVINQFDMGYYGQDYLEIRQSCDSYLSTAAYGGTNRRAQCTVGSNSTSAIHKNEEVYGSIKTNGDIDAEPPFGGEACADFAPGCPNKGETCAGEDCGVPLLEHFGDWSEYCPTNQGDLTVPVGATVVLTVAGEDPNQKCWRNVTINRNGILRLTTTGLPYFFQSINFAHGTAQLIADPAPADKTVELYLLEIVGNRVNGNQTINLSQRPTSLMIYYLGEADLDFNGNAAMHLAFVAPNAGATISGSFQYFGALLAKRLYMTGSGQVHYDESLGGQGPIVDVQYRVRAEVPKYR